MIFLAGNINLCWQALRGKSIAGKELPAGKRGYKTFWTAVQKGSKNLYNNL